MITHLDLMLKVSYQVVLGMVNTPEKHLCVSMCLSMCNRSQLHSKLLDEGGGQILLVHMPALYPASEWHFEQVTSFF